MDSEDANGTVAFTIDFTDLAGNQGTQATAILSGSNITFDKTAPGTNSITVASSNATSTLATSGDVITVTVVANENLQTDRVKAPLVYLVHLLLDRISQLTILVHQPQPIGRLATL